MKKLLVIIPDKISSLIKKGEITNRYYNPGEIFDEVHILMTNNDEPNKSLLNGIAGRAKLFIHNYPESPRFFRKTLGWRPVLMNEWASGAINLVKKINPDLIRCHGAHLNAFIAAKVKETLGIPYVISLHINPERDIRLHPKKELNAKEMIIYKLQRSFERYAIAKSDVTVCVYNWIKSYAEQYGASDIRTIYNVINKEYINEKHCYEIDESNIKLIVPGRQFIKKDPSLLIEIANDMPNVHLTLVGDGPYNNKLKDIARNSGIENRVEFLSSLPNRVLCETLKDYDMLVSVNDYGGVSKVELEASFVGMPVITNSHPYEELPEVLGENALVYDDKESLNKCILAYINDKNLRESFGTNLRNSVKHLAGDLMEKKYSDLYMELMEGNNA